MKFFPGRRIDYEPKHCEKQRNDQDFLTAIEFSAEHPYGKAVALFDLKSGTIKVDFCLVCILLPLNDSPTPLTTLSLPFEK